MAETAKETAHRASLKAAMEKWLEDDHSLNDPLCYVGPNAASAMADAAYAVLQGMADLETYFESEQMLNP